MSNGVIFGDPTTGLGFGNPDVDPQIGLGIPAPATPMNSRLVCPTRIDCPGTDFPVTNYSSENLDAFSQPFAREDCVDGYCCDSSYHFACGLTEDDAADALRRELFLCDPCPKPSFEPTYCATAACPDGTSTVTRCSNISQDDAQALANAAAQEPTCGQQTPPPPPPPCNEAQTCSRTSADGSLFTFTVPACTVYGANAATANAIASGLACQRANRYEIFLSDLPRFTCLGSPYSGTITPSRSPGGVINYTVLDSLPPGLAITNITATRLTISGVSTTAGNYTFRVLATSASGGSVLKSYTVCVVEQTVSPTGIDSSHLPDANIGKAYSVALSATACAATPILWQLQVAGSLPDGLSLDPITGVISGTVAGDETPGDFVFHVVLQTGSTEVDSLSCTKEWTVKVVNSAFPPGPFNLDGAFLAVVQHYQPAATGILVQTLGNGYYQDSGAGNKVYTNIYNPFGYFNIYLQVAPGLFAIMAIDSLSAVNPAGTYHWNPAGLAPGFGYPPGAATIT